MRSVRFLVLGLATFGACSPGTAPQDASDDPLDRRFATEVRPFFERYCFSCHGPAKQKADLNLSRDFSPGAVAKNLKHWDQVRARIQALEMPPEDTSRQPKPAEREAAVAWLADVSDREAKRNAGDPGLVLARRLSNAEYDYTIRDLTGVDIRPTREFPVDPANEAGFDNSGESLAMSEALLKKYLGAARLVADHVVLERQGFVFAPHPVATDTDRDKYCVQRIMAFYARHKVELAEYLGAARGGPEAGLSPAYLAAIRTLIQEEPAAASPVAEFWSEAKTLPRDADGARQLAATVVRLREKFPAKVEAPQVKGISRGSQPLLLWRNDALAAQHRKPEGQNDPDVKRFCAVFPDAFVVLERGPYYDKGSSPKGRFLSAGFHLMQGYYRDDRPLYDLVLDETSRREIDLLWDELHFVSQDYLRQYKDFIFFERAEPPRFMFDASFDFARSEDKDAVSEPKIRQLRESYLAKAARLGATAPMTEAIGSYFTSINARLREIEEAHRAAEASHLDSLRQFADRAWRRRPSDAEQQGILKFYHRLREQDQLSHEDAVRDTLASILMSPHFLYRFPETPEKSEARVALTDNELANRLSYFLWSSLPDAELRRHAAAGDLHQSGVLKAEARRMLADPKARGFATEFVGHWLDFRRFEEHNAVDRERFPSFTNDLRQSMYEEPIRWFQDAARRDRSILDLLYANDTIVNRTLAKHYGMPEPAGEDWTPVDDARAFGRGGLLPMAVFLTQNAPGLRTSPVKRGYWVVRRLLGEVIPPPPPTVPTLPKDEANLGELTLPQVLARHRDDPACAGCHKRFDSVGLIFEGYGPIGEFRAKDLGGKPVQDTGTFPDGKDRRGLEGLREYLRDRRENDFIENFCRKLLSYALSRSLQPSDRATIQEMRRTDRLGIGGLIEVIVTSPQFLNQRGGREQR